MKIQFILLGALLHVGAVVSATTWEYVDEPDRSLALSGPQGVLWRLNFSKDLPHACFDPVRTLDGRDITWISTRNHRWHLGLWFAWKCINGVNYWEFVRGTGFPAGRAVIEKVEIIERGDQQARVRIDRSLRPEMDAEPVARETVWLRIETPRPDGAYAIDWRQRTEALVDVEFGRSTGYGGLSFRAAPTWTQPRFLNSEGGEGRQAAHLASARWLDLSATSGGSPLGLTIFDHPANPRHPTPWFLVERIMGDEEEQWPFFYSNAALLGEEPLELKAGQHLDLFYRILIHPGATAEMIEAEYSRFKALPLNPGVHP